MKKKTYCYETLCHKCNKTTRWVLNPNGEQGKVIEQFILNHRIYSDEHPFEIRYCENCDMDTRQERVAWDRF